MLLAVDGLLCAVLTSLTLPNLGEPCLEYGRGAALTAEDTSANCSEGIGKDSRRQLRGIGRAVQEGSRTSGAWPYNRNVSLSSSAFLLLCEQPAMRFLAVECFISSGGKGGDEQGNLCVHAV